MVNIMVNGKKIDVPDKKPLIQVLRDRGEHIPGFCYIEGEKPYGSCRLCLVKTQRGITTSCTLQAVEGLEVETLSRDVVDMRRSALELLLSDHYGDCIGPCQDACPAHSDVQGYLALIGMGMYHKAVKLMKEKYILPAVLGRVCPAFCEKACRRNLVDEPVAIRQLKRYAADYDIEHGPWMPEIAPPTGKKIAVIGGGPAGLSCAYYLRVMGHSVTIFEAMPELGGMTMYGIPSYRLPKNVLKSDVDTVIKTGIEVRTNTAIGGELSLETLQNEYDSVFLGIGAWKSRKMGIPGENLNGVVHGIEFLRRVNTGEKVALGHKVVVVGGGNTAMDVARTALRLGSEVTVVYRRSRGEMPADVNEVVEAEEEGVKFLYLTNPVKIAGTDKISMVELVKMRLGEPDSSGRRKPIPIKGSNFEISADTVILAIGQYCDENLLRNLKIKNQRGKAVVDDITLQTSIEGVFAGGDLVLGPSTVIESIATGRRAALMIDLYLKGKLELTREILLHPSEHIHEVLEDEELYRILFDLKPYNHWKNVTVEDYKDVERKPRAKVMLKSAEDRSHSFEEVEPRLAEAQVKTEAFRCMSCGCMEAFRCKLREYATLYDAKQDTFVGELNRFEIDDSHPHIVLDSNKCVLCGQCVNFTQEISGEGLVDYLFRGFVTKIAPPVGEKMKDVHGDFVGELVDVCPVGAIIEKSVQSRPGPWKTDTVQSVCNGCGFACNMGIEIYEDMVVRAISVRDSWNGHICDKCRFARPWINTVQEPLLNGKKITWAEAEKFLSDREFSLLLTPELSNEEIVSFVNYAKKNRIEIGALVEHGISTATLSDIKNARTVLLKADVERYPILKIMLRGKKIVEENYDVAILEAPAEPLRVPTLILHRGMNAVGLLKSGVSGIPEHQTYVVIGNTNRNLNGDVIELPLDAWAHRGGTVINVFNMELHAARIKEENHRIMNLFKRLKR